MSVLIEHRGVPEGEIDGFRHLQEILESKCFERAATLRSLLLYLWNNRSNEISEYAIAVDGLRRSQDFESKIDATVRVQISRLRRLLTRYYESEGRQSRTRLTIPLGTHQIQVLELPPESASEGGEEGNPQDHLLTDGMSVPVPAPSFSAVLIRRQRLAIAALAAVVAALLSCVGWLLLTSHHPVARNVASSKPALPLFWKRFMDNGKPTRIVLPTPVFFSWHLADHRGALMVRDISVNQFDKSEDSAQIADLEKKLGKPGQWQNYTVASDTFASLRLARFLDSYGVQTFFSGSAESPREILDHENVIAFGTTTSLSAYQSDLDRLSYKLGPHEAYVIDERQPAGKRIQFPVQVESASRMIVPGLVALLPRGSSGSRILLVQAAQTMALISWMTSDEGMREITQAEDEHGHGQYFEAVVLSEVNAGNPIQSRMVAFRPFAGKDAQPDQGNTTSVR